MPNSIILNALKYFAPPLPSVFVVLQACCVGRNLLNWLMVRADL